MVNLYINSCEVFDPLVLRNTGVVINIEFPSYTVNESSVSVEVCAVIADGSLERSVVVFLTTLDGSATGWYELSYMLRV